MKPHWTDWLGLAFISAIGVRYAFLDGFGFVAFLMGWASGAMLLIFINIRLPWWPGK